MESFYYHEKCPEGVKAKKFKLIVLDKHRKPFLPLTVFYTEELGRISDSSAKSYLKTLYTFFTWLRTSSNYQGRTVNWDDDPKIIRIAVEDFLMQEAHCKVTTSDGKTHYNVLLTNRSPNTVSRMLSALKSFYKAMIHNKMYPYPNPLIDSHAILDEYETQRKGIREGKPRMPKEAGTEEPLPKRARRLTDSFFKVINGEWKPQIIDNPHLPFIIYKAGEYSKWKLRDEIITRMLFQTGARAREVIELTFGDYRARQDKSEFSTFNKGSHGKRTKFLKVDDDTLKLLDRYIHGERKKVDKSGLSINDFRDKTPLFLNHYGRPYTYDAFLKNWLVIIEKAEMKINIHKTRHWFVTRSIRMIRENYKDKTEQEKAIERLRIYMNWSTKADTIKIYEHYVDEKDYVAEQHDKLLETMKKEQEEYLNQLKPHKRAKQPSVEPQNKVVQLSKKQHSLLDRINKMNG
ncbi:tyrosine-type recombinase/integrase [Bacillus paranthracis]|uniref:tyrosine-type recombinase/integrase n=1 Tax=Bacillus paranthracis TaxID=2026186 RepID=UPI001E3520D7|nr:site-specific integrase [Bacillus paranthracis]MCC2359089.1 site-specific integrase [Bacillus paranthracis]